MGLGLEIWFDMYERVFRKQVFGGRNGLSECVGERSTRCEDREEEEEHEERGWRHQWG